ncbi:MAG: cytosine permease, partial [Desulfobacterales bacterium]|nr:cytosine permease [Desulfobacterales bacterium]
MNNQGKHQLTFFSYLFLWFGAAISIAEIMTGGLLSPLGFKNGLQVIFIGHLIGTTILVLGGVIGYNEKLPAIQSTQISFGMYGTYLFTILNVLQLIGWTAVMIISGARSINIISKILWSFDAIHFWSILIGLLICFWIYLGMTGFKKINIVAVSLLFLLTIVLSTVIFKEKALFTKESVGTMAFGLGLELNVIMPLSWLPLIADYTRFSRSKKDCLWGSWIGYFIGSSWMYFIGLGAGILSN